MKYWVISFLVFCFSIKLFAQNNDYWQQRVDHQIDVKLDTARKMLVGFQTITYHNNSPDTLNKIYFHLWPNAYASHESALGKQFNRQGVTKLYFAKDEFKGYIDSLNFTYNEKPATYIYVGKHEDVATLFLPEALLPGQKASITCSFKVKIPSCRFSRLGVCGNSYQITQWYPKPAVYDKNGWNPMPYLHFGEYYNDFGFYKVNITLPPGFGIGATGNLISGNQLADKTSNEPYKTLIFEQDSVTDFAWFCDTDFKYLSESQSLGEQNKLFKADVFYRNDEYGYWKESPTFIRDAVLAYSKWVGAYPYSHATAVDGAITAGSGMEYPMITVIAQMNSKISMDHVITHEIGHNWFQGMLASNERVFPFMDEGLNSFYDNRHLRNKHPDEKLSMIGSDFIERLLKLNKISEHDQFAYFYAMQARQNKDLACNLPAENYSEINGGIIVYGKTSLALRNLYGWLGESRFDKAMQHYFNTWKFKHPQPEDFRKCIEESTGSNLDWFFNDLLETRKKTDYAIRKVKNKDDKQYIIVKNKGDVAAPFPITASKADSSITFWYDGFQGSQKLSFPTAYFDRFVIDQELYTLDVNRKNNSYDRNRLFKKQASMRWSFLTGLEMPNENEHYLIPAPAWNKYNGFMLGMMFHNISIMERNFEYSLTPLYSFGSNDLAGYAAVNYHIKPLNGPFRKISVGINASSFANDFNRSFRRFAPYLSIIPHKKRDDSPLTHEIKLRSVQIAIDNTPTLELLGSKMNNALRIQELSWFMENKRGIDPFNLTSVLQQGTGFVKAQATFNYRISYLKKKKGLDMRFFAGSFLWKNLATVPDVRFRLSGQSGYQDYLYDAIFPARFENDGLWSQQFTETDGGFKEFSFRGQTFNYLLAVNLKASLPGKIPLRLYLDIGHYENGETDKDNIAYGGGVMLNLIRNQFEVYFPLLVSPAIKQTASIYNNGYFDRVRFTLNLHNLNLSKLLKNIDL